MKMTMTVCAIALLAITGSAQANMHHAKGHMKSQATASSMNGNTAQNNNWFGPQNNGGKTNQNNDWFANNNNDNGMPKGKKSKMGGDNQQSSNTNWFGPQPVNDGSKMRKGRMSSANQTSNNWFAPSNGTNK